MSITCLRLQIETKHISKYLWLQTHHNSSKAFKRCMQFIHEAGWGLPQQVITTAQAMRKQVKQIQAGF